MSLAGTHHDKFMVFILNLQLEHIWSTDAWSTNGKKRGFQKLKDSSHFLKCWK